MKKEIHKNKHKYTKPVYFGDLKDGEHFFWGNQEYIKTVRVYYGVSVYYPFGLGYSNTIQISNNQVSGMGDLVEIQNFLKCK